MDLPRLRRTIRGDPLKADPSAQLRLLELQELDAQLGQLAHRRRSLPEHSVLEELEQQRAALDARVRDLRITADDTAGELKRANADVEQVRARRERDQQRMDSGAIANPKDLERMQHELVSLSKRISDLEDIELEVMERLETTQQELTKVSDELADVEGKIAAATGARDHSYAEIDGEVADLHARRGSIADDVPDDLRALYDKLRAAKGGVGAAPLRARRCEGCSLELTASDLGAVRAAPADEVVRCEECQRILVRTAESGL